MELITIDLKKEIYLRIEKLRHNMKKNNVDAILINANTNIYYLSGRFFRGYIFISVDKTPFWFIVKPGIYKEEENIRYVRKPELIPEILSKCGYNPSCVGLEFDDLSYSDVVRLSKLFPGVQIVNGSRLLKETRMIKTDWEILQMKFDGLRQCEVYSKVSQCYRPGMSDLMLQIEIERELRIAGSLGVSRVSGNLMDINLGSVISGENADNPGPYEFTMGGSGVDPSLPVGADNTPILPNTTVMIDMNGAFNGYQTDMTRVWGLGEISKLAEKAHQCSIKILRNLEKSALPGVPVAELYKIAINIVEKDGLSEYFMGHKSRVSFIGHGVGIELNEMPVLNARNTELIQENMTIAIEPKFVIPHVGAVGVENTYQVTPGGLKNLTIFPENINKL